MELAGCSHATGVARRVRVVAADDSAVMRYIVRHILREAAEQLELCAVAEDGVGCLRMVEMHRPDVVLLDVEMPGVGGLDALRQLQHVDPALPVVMCSSYTECGAAVTLAALAAGAADYITKPGVSTDGDAVQHLREQLVCRLMELGSRSQRTATATHSPAAPSAAPECLDRCRVVVIGASTGGPAALEELLAASVEPLRVPVLVVQHMPALFLSALCARLRASTGRDVRLAQPGDRLRAGQVLVAPGDRHTVLEHTADGAVVRLSDSPPEQGCRPAVDPLMVSVATVYGDSTAAMVLTGMGADGLRGARAMVDRGAPVAAQDERSSAIWGMPRQIVEAGLGRARSLPELRQMLWSAGRRHGP